MARAIGRSAAAALDAMGGEAGALLITNWPRAACNTPTASYRVHCCARMWLELARRGSRLTTTGLCCWVDRCTPEAADGLWGILALVVSGSC